VANIVALGAFSVLTPILKKSSLKDALLKRVPKGTEGLNLLAFEEGVKAGRIAKRTSIPIVISERVDEDT
jgi:2-oxoglutarate ferredoxin oxidoreductase subunit gamma